MVEVIFDEKFKELFSKIKDNSIKIKIIKQVEKIKINPEIGKPMRNVRKGTRELYIKPFRLSYEYFRDKNVVYILDIYHKDEQ
ncbi:type II toxin-antitoxin system RelE/ParE family toxin [Candidatus Woesearchaeota archaeon]|nr:type II toxin-antitoxin system RelE/ParE family toxin [Candidatus Woesearchaeota archaeon]